MNSATIAVRIDPETKKEAQEVLSSIGLDMSSAINIFLKQVIADDGLPFRPAGKKARPSGLSGQSISESRIAQALENGIARFEAEHGIGKTFNSVDDLMEELNNA